MKKHLTGMILALALTVTGLAGAQAAYAATSVKADVIEYNTKSGVTTATGNVVITKEDGIVKAAAGEYNTKTSAGRLTGGVNAVQKDARTTCDTLVMHDEHHLTASGSAMIKKQDKTLRAEQVEYYQDREFVETVGSWGELALDDGSVLKADYINYDMRAGLATAEGQVAIVSEVRKLTANADKAIYDLQQEGIIELIGHAVAVQDGNTITGNKLKITNNDQTAQAFGQVKLVYIPVAQPVAKPVV
ncbi:MAG: LptA/OstA family protein [Acidaminococcaceae bacterium]